MSTQKRTTDAQATTTAAPAQAAAVGGTMFAVAAPLLTLGAVFTARGRTALGLTFLAAGVVLTAVAAGYLGTYVRRSRAVQVTGRGTDQDDR